jgi:predicted flap endonuclease-1-like 5' DNA nuclease
MNFWTTLLLGIFIGWLIEWVIDWVYWRKKAARPVVADKTVELKAAEEKIAVLESRLANAEEVRVDPLEKIKGIGPVIKTKLYSGGILSFKQLGNLTSAELEAIVGDDIKRLADEDEIIRQAKEFAQKG